MVYHLNLKWKMYITGSAAVVSLLGLALIIYPFIDGDSEKTAWLPVVIGAVFLIMGAESIYEGFKTKVELSDDGIVYHQSRYIFSAHWMDLQSIAPSSGALIMQFSTSNLVRGGILYRIVRALGLHNGLAINYFLNEENSRFIKDKIAKALGLTDPIEIRSLVELLK